MNLVKKRLSKKQLLILLLIASSAFVLLGSEASQRLRRVVHPVLAPLGDGGMYLATLVKLQVRRITAKGLTGAEADELRRRNEEFRGRLIAVEGEHARLLRQRHEMDSLFERSFSGFPCKLLPARVVGYESLPYGHSRVVNAGSRRGVVPGALVTTRRMLTDRSKSLPPPLAVISSTAVVGRLTDAGPFTARLQLLTDPGFTIVANIYRTLNPRDSRWITSYTEAGAIEQRLSEGNNSLIEVVARGDGTGLMVIKQVEEYHNVLPGDWLLSSGKEAFLPALVRIGKVVEVTRPTKHPGFVTLKVKPHADLESLREVYIIYPLGKPKDDSDRGAG